LQTKFSSVLATSHLNISQLHTLILCVFYKYYLSFYAVVFKVLFYLKFFP
jgi:hypothetical protein